MPAAKRQGPVSVNVNVSGAKRPRYKRDSAAVKYAKLNLKRFPISKYGRMFVERGNTDNIALFGPSWAEATDIQKENRKRLGYYGRGKYWGKALGSAIGGIGGMLLGGPKGAAIGSKVGGHFGDKWSGKGIYTGRGVYTGRGEYEEETRSNELISNSDEKAPVIESAGDETGALMITHREYVGDIFAPPTATVSDFTVQSFPLNPGLEQTFPWLSQIAQNYEEYELVQCVFEYVSTVQDINSANGQVGTIITATQYNASKPDFTDKPAMAAYAHSVSGKSTDNQNHGVECDPSKLSGSEGKFVRANPVLVGEDLKTYDHGRFQLATHNIPSAMAGGSLGELYVYYTVKLRKPKFFTGRGLGVNRWLAVADKTVMSSQTFQNTMGSDLQRLYARQNNIAIKLEALLDHNLLFTFPAYFGGRLRIIGNLEGQGLQANWLTGESFITLGGNVKLIADNYAADPTAGDGAAAVITHNSGSVRRYFCISIEVAPVTNAVDNTLKIITALIAGTLNQASIEIMEYNTFQSDDAPVLVNPGGVVTPLPGPQ